MKIIISYLPSISRRKVLKRTKKYFQKNCITDGKHSFWYHDMLLTIYKDAVEILSLNESESGFKHLESYLDYVFNNNTIGIAFSIKGARNKLLLKNVEVFYS